MHCVIVGSVWIGLSRENADSEFYWESTGELLTWTNWQGSQPWAPAGQSSDCVLSNDNGWNDVDCQGVRYPVCELPDN